MKIRVLPSVEELAEVLAPYYDMGLTQFELSSDRDVIEYIIKLLVNCGFEVSHEVEVDDKIVEQLEYALAHPETHVRGRERPRRRSNDELHTKFR